MDIVPLDGCIGAELRGVDLTQELSLELIQLTREAFKQYFLVLAREQKLEGEYHDRFVQILGPLQTLDSGSSYEYMTNTQTEKASRAGMARLLFHNDGAYRDHPRAGTSLYAMSVSPNSPPTSFANGVLAYERLDAGIKRQVEQLHAMHILDYDDPAQESRRVRVADFPRGRRLNDVRHAVHPVVVTLPRSGRKALFVSEFYTSHVVEFGPYSDQGERLLQQLFSMLYTESNIYSHHYRNGDLIVWDNYALQHARPSAIDNNPRHLRRVVLKSLAS